jgi:hypothetical protein
MNTSFSIGLRLVCEYLEAAIALYERGERRQVLNYVQSARQSLQTYEEDLLAAIAADPPPEPPSV